MIQEIALPEISENVDSASVVSILVSPGDRVSDGQAILEVETDKASAEVPATVSGTVEEVLVSEGEEVRIGVIIARINTEETGAKEEAADRETEEGAGEAEPSPDEREAAEEEAGDAQAAEDEAEAPAAERGEAGEGAGPAEAPAAGGIPPAAGGSVPAAPSTRRLAREIGVDITEVKGTGPGGRVSADDVKRHARDRAGGAGAAGGRGAGAAPSAFVLPDFSKWGETRREKLGQVRRITAENTQAAWRTIPHVTQFDEADVTALEEFRRAYAKRAERAGVKLTVTAILVKVAAKALERFPRFNASLDAAAGELVYKQFINISVAADTDRGLLVPVLRDAERKSIMTLARELGDLAERARTKRIKPEEMEGGTFTISNLGGIGGTGFTPVVFAPQVAILGVARSETKPVWREGQFVPRLKLPLSLSYDHRAADGADGARFLRWICESLEQPLYMELQGAEDE